MKKTIALLGQPNSGKSSVFNGLTGSHQHIGNWPGKTVERKTGSFTYNKIEYDVIDLPGSYSLSAESNEERITSDYIRSGAADLVAILVDSSQLERSLYMYTDFIGITTPVILILNLMDVAQQKGLQIDVEKLSRRMGIPVIGFVASDAKRYGALKETLANAVSSPEYLQPTISSGATLPTPVFPSILWWHSRKNLLFFPKRNLPSLSLKKQRTVLWHPESISTNTLTGFWTVL